jgi:hypothetical protein
MAFIIYHLAFIIAPLKELVLIVGNSDLKGLKCLKFIRGVKAQVFWSL